MLLYYITDRRSFSGSEAERRIAVVRRISQAAQAGVDYIQLREKDLSPRELERLAHDAVRAVRDNSTKTRLLINGRSDVALACDADGVHLPSGDLPASEVRALWLKCSHRPPLIGVSAHSTEDVRHAEAHGADFAVLAPIFEKLHTAVPTIGLQALREACSPSAAAGSVEASCPTAFAVLALGGVNLENAGSCLAAGASGIAGIRLFQTATVSDTVRRLRELESRAR